MKDNTPLYNSKIIKNYLEYLTRYYPEIDTVRLLDFSGISLQEIRDPSHWLTQDQVNRFHEILNSVTGNSAIAREAGRYVVSSEAFGTIKASLLGLLSPLKVYEIVARISHRISRHTVMKCRKLGPNMLRITSQPRNGVKEEPFQCENRIGTLESLAMLNTDAFAHVTHDECIHRGGSCCRYIVTLDRQTGFILKRVRNWFIVTGSLLSLVLIFMLPFNTWLIAMVMFLLSLLLISLRVGHVNRVRLARVVEEQRRALEKLYQSADIQYNNALLIQKVGQAASNITDLDSFARSVSGILERYLDFDRGLIIIKTGEPQSGRLISEYGFTPEQISLLRSIRFDSAVESGQWPMGRAFRDLKHFVYDHADPSSPASAAGVTFLTEKLGTSSCICVPIIYEHEALGVIYLDNTDRKRSILKSDVNLLMGIASQAALFITNECAFGKIIDNEQRYRSIFENTGTATIIIEKDRTISLVNSRFEALSGYSREEIEGKSDWKIFVAEKDFVRMAQQHSLRRENPDGASINYEFTFIARTGEQHDILLTINMIPGTTQSVASLLDITERKHAEGSLRKSLKEKETLLKEIHHRVKNNMQIVTSLLGLESARVHDDKDRMIFLSSIERIRAMAQVHERLYQSENLSLIDFKDYLRDLTRDIADSYHSDSRRVRVSISSDDIHLDIESAIPCGLIVNELITNSFRHAFNNTTEGEITVSLNHGQDSGYILKVRDNGAGFPEGLLHEDTGSLGLQLVTMLVRQLKGSLEYEGETGASFTIRFGIRD